MIAQVGFIYHACMYSDRHAISTHFNSIMLQCTDDARFWWFEVWDLGRKLFLNCVVGLLASSAANRMISGLVVL